LPDFPLKHRLLHLIDRPFSDGFPSSPTGWDAAGKIMGLVSAGGPASPFVDLIGPVNEGKKAGNSGTKIRPMRNKRVGVSPLIDPQAGQ